MKFDILSAFAVILTILVVSCNTVFAVDIKFGELRYCGKPKRNSDGVIIRSTSVKAQFKKFHPCPSTGLISGACPGWAVDHVLPLACGYCDSVINMQWLDDETKSLKDRYERNIYASDEVLFPACKNKIIK